MLEGLFIAQGELINSNKEKEFFEPSDISTYYGQIVFRGKQAEKQKAKIKFHFVMCGGSYSN